MRATPQSPRSRFPKGQPRQSGNHAPNPPPPPHPTPPHRVPHSPSHARFPTPFALSLSKAPLTTEQAPQPTPPAAHPPSSYRRKPVSRGARRGAPPPKPPSYPQLPVVGAVREPPVPPQRDPHPTTSSPRRHPTPPIVVPANAGIQGRGAARGVSVPHRIPHSPPHTRLPNPFALSLSKPVLRALEEAPPTNTPRRPTPPHRRTGESRNPEGRRAGHPHPNPRRFPDSPS